MSYYLMHRGWMENPALNDGEPFTRPQAWCWMIEEAAFVEQRVRVGGKVINLERGQLSCSLRFLARQWKWGHERVRRFLARLQNEMMIETAIETGQFIITICNYDKYQDGSETRETVIETRIETGIGARQQRDRNRDSSETGIETAKNSTTTWNVKEFSPSHEPDETGSEASARQPRRENRDKIKRIKEEESQNPPQNPPARARAIDYENLPARACGINQEGMPDTLGQVSVEGVFRGKAVVLGNESMAKCRKVYPYDNLEARLLTYDSYWQSRAQFPAEHAILRALTDDATKEAKLRANGGGGGTGHKSGKTAPVVEAFQLLDQDPLWKLRYDAWRRDGFWMPLWGNEPGQPGCRVPAHILQSAIRSVPENADAAVRLADCPARGVNAREG